MDDSLVSNMQYTVHHISDLTTYFQKRKKKHLQDYVTTLSPVNVESTEKFLFA